MSFLDLFNKSGKEKNKEMEAVDETINQKVHDKKNEFQKHIFKVRKESSKLHEQIEEAKMTSRKIQKLLTVTEATFLSLGGKLH